MLLLLCVVVVLANLHSGIAQNVVHGGTFSQSAVNVAKKAVLTINVDNEYQLYWNGELVDQPYQLQQVTVYELVPVPICNYPNVLAIKATDHGGVAGVIMQLEYAGLTYKMGTSPEILLTDAYSDDPAWYLKPYSDPTVWAKSNTLASCDMDPTEDVIERYYYQPGASWRWYKNCNELNKSVFVKLVVYTNLNSSCD